MWLFWLVFMEYFWFSATRKYFYYELVLLKYSLVSLIDYWYIYFMGYLIFLLGCVNFKIYWHSKFSVSIIVLILVKKLLILIFITEK